VGPYLSDTLGILDFVLHKLKARVGEREEEGDDFPHRSLECGSGMEVKIQCNGLWLVMIIEDRDGVVNRNHV